MSAPSNVATIAEVLAAPDVSHWLKNALRSATARDPVDAALDADLLRLLLNRRAEDVLAGGQSGFQLQGDP